MLYCLLIRVPSCIIIGSLLLHSTILIVLKGKVPLRSFPFGWFGKCSSYVSVAERLQVMSRTVHWIRGWWIAAPAVTFVWIRQHSFTVYYSYYILLHISPIPKECTARVKLERVASGSWTVTRVLIYCGPLASETNVQCSTAVQQQSPTVYWLLHISPTHEKMITCVKLESATGSWTWRVCSHTATCSHSILLCNKSRPIFRSHTSDAENTFCWCHSRATRGSPIRK